MRGALKAAAFAAVLLSFLNGTFASAQDSAAAPATIALARTFADGRTQYDLVSTRPGRLWTAQIPRFEPGTAPWTDVAPPYAIQFARVLAGERVKVEIAALYMPGLTEQPVATVTVGRGEEVVVRELERFGVKPVTLSIVDVDPVSVYLPTVLTPTPEVEVFNVELLQAPYPGYRVTLRNLSNRSIASLEVQSYRGEREAISSSPRGQNGRPAMTPGGTFDVTFNLTGGSSNGVPPSGHITPQPLDVIDVNFVRWEDGGTDGRSRFPGMAAMLPDNGGRRMQLNRIIPIYRDALNGAARGAEALLQVESRITGLADFEGDQLPEARNGMMQIKGAALADIRRFSADAVTRNDASAVRLWMLVAVERYEQMLLGLAR